MGTKPAGRPTASGEAYDPNELTAASKTLPLGSTVEVTNLSNGRSVKVRINDRGPYVKGRSIDLSKRAAEEIGLTEKGVDKVKIRRIDSKPAAHATPAAREATKPKSDEAPATEPPLTPGVSAISDSTTSAANP